MPALALLLALLVFVPDVAIAGSWASPARVLDVGAPAETAAIDPAQLVRPITPTPPDEPHVLLLVLVSTLLDGGWLVAAAPRATPAETGPRLGRFGRGNLQTLQN